MKPARNVYLKMKTLQEARRILREAFPPPASGRSETIPVLDAVGRVLAEAAVAQVSSPNFHAAAMDGIAVKAEQTYGASETKPKELIIGRDASYINTGHVLPAESDAVIMIEKVNVQDPQRVTIEAPAFPWQYVRKMGEDIVATEMLFAQNHVVSPYCVGALLSGGVFEVAVKAKPRVLLVPTGSELVDWRGLNLEDLDPGQVIESNAYVVGLLVEAAGGIAVKHDAVPDDLSQITSVITAGIEDDFDIILAVGGSSAGSEDFSKQVISSLGEVLVHGVTIMPGKPVIIGKIKQKPVFGLPGYPVSAIVAFEQFVRPLLCGMLGQPETARARLNVEPTRKIPSKLGVEEFLRVKLGRVGERVVATPLPRGAGSITTLTEADGIIRVPHNLEGLREDEVVAAELLRDAEMIDNTIVAVGSHDNALDILADQLRAGHGGLTLSSSHVGSMGGLMAIKRGVCHLAGSHLLDTEDGTYNISYVKRLLPDVPVQLVHLVMRDQGLIVPAGNPKGLRGIEDLAREGLMFINRQGGSGTRILLDFRLQQVGIDPGQIAGYDTEEYTHMSVAAAVLSGAADVGLGIYAAAKALDLDFIPVVTEQYDLVIPERFFNTATIQVLRNTITTPIFKKRVEALGGYDTARTGTIIT